MTDVELLNQHRHGSDAAFADLVRRHLGWVYGVARRRLRDAHLAEDVSQAVFVLLHRKAPQFAADSAMINWLHKTAWYASETAARTERRRRARETEAAIMQPTTVDSSDPADWQQLAPLLDQLIGKLSRSDREAILLRYYRDLPFADIAIQIGTTPDTARKRVDRAIEKLRRLAADKGAALSIVSLSNHLLNHVRLIPPPGLVATATVTATAPAGSAMAASTAGIVKGALTMSSAKITAVTIVAIALVAVTGSVCATIWVLSSSSPGPAASISAPVTPPKASQVETPTGQTDFNVTNAQMRRLAPFTAIRWHDIIPEVQIKNTWYALIAVNEVTVNQIMVSQTNPAQHRKHFAEDLVELMTRMGHPPADTVNLQVQTLGSDKKNLTLQNVPMTEENRQTLMNWPALGQTSLFQGYRLNDSVPQIEENDTWYELLAIDRIPLEKIKEAAEVAYGPDWKNHNVMEMLTSTGHKPQGETLLELRTLDTNETVTLTVRAPESP